ncbi:hypothetical protein DV736_g6657, partial [Chaetothyriales sp. CBS 134916]
MYLRAVHAELHISSLRNFIIDNPLGLLITSLQNSSFPTIQCTHIPWILDVTDSSSKTELGKLRGHLARANPHSKAMTEVASASASPGKLSEEVSVVFTGPVYHYVTPKFYIETKSSTGKVVPTWNYSAVQAYGTAAIFFNPKAESTSSFLQKQISDLSNHAETTTIMGYEKPWAVGDAPDNYIDVMKKSIIGIEIEITRLEGKWKMSQELNEGDRQGVIEGFRELDNQAGRAIAALVAERAEMKDKEKTAVS